MTQTDWKTGFRVEEFTSLESSSSLQPQWNALAERAPNVTVFSTWEWQTTWWKHYGAGNVLRLIAVHKGERLVGLLPLYTKRTALAAFFGMREAQLVGAGGDTSPDYLGPLIEPDCEQAVADILAERVVDTRSEWDVLNFTDMSPGPFLELLVKRLNATGLDVKVSTSNTIKVARLPGTWDEYLATMHRDRRYRVRNLRRNALQKLGAQFRLPQTDAQLWAAVDDLIALHHKRWASKDDTKGAFRSTPYVGFHREAIERCHRQGWVRLYCMEAAGKAAAVFYCYRYRDEVLYFQSGFDPELEKFSLGQVLMGFAIESAIAEGAKVFDLLKGDHPYKNSWSNDVRATFDLLAHNTSVLGRLGRLRGKLAAFMKTRNTLTPSSGPPAVAIRSPRT